MLGAVPKVQTAASVADGGRRHAAVIERWRSLRVHGRQLHVLVNATSGQPSQKPPAWPPVKVSKTGAHGPPGSGRREPASAPPAARDQPATRNQHDYSAGHPASRSPTGDPDPQKLEALRAELADQGIKLRKLVPGQYRMVCPYCRGGNSGEPCFSMIVFDNCQSAYFNCFRASCGANGHVRAAAVASNGSGGRRPGDSSSAGPLGTGAGHSTPMALRAGGVPGPRQQPAPLPAPPQLRPLHAEALDYFASLGVTAATLQRNRVAMEEVVPPGGHAPVKAVAFPYFRGRDIVAVKYFVPPAGPSWLVGSADGAGMYGAQQLAQHVRSDAERRSSAPSPIDVVAIDAAAATTAAADGSADFAAAAATPVQEVIIVDSEVDKLVLEEAGFWNTIAVPDALAAVAGLGSSADGSRATQPPDAAAGGPFALMAGGPPSTGGGSSRALAGRDGRFGYVWASRQLLEACQRFVLAISNTAAGEILGEELARRLGRERCWRVRWPCNAGETMTALDAAEAGGGESAGGGGAPSASAGGQFSYVPRSGHAAVLAAEFSVYSASLFQGNTNRHMLRTPAYQPQQTLSSGQDASSADAAGGHSSPFDLAVDAGGGGFDSGDSAAAATAAPDAEFRLGVLDVLLQDGPDALRWYLARPEPFPVRGLFAFSTYWQEIYEYFVGAVPFGEGASTGWPGLDAYYKVVPGELTIVTGVPNSGKSEWLDALMVNLAESYGWPAAFCSMEKSPRDHARQLLEKHMHRPFFDAAYADSAERMTPQEVYEGMVWIDQAFALIKCQDEEIPDIDWVLAKAKAAVLRHGIRGLVIDPYNELDHRRPRGMSETEYVSQMLTKVKRFAQHYDVHVWFVAHPRQMKDWRGSPPTLYDISGSAHFVNKADNGIVVHRNWSGSGDPSEVRIIVLKVRNKAAGRTGEYRLRYDRVTGRYSDPAAAAAPRLSSGH